MSGSGNCCSWTASRSCRIAARSAQWNRGAYLVNSLGHCAECHSPRNFLGGIIAAQRFAGGPNPEGEGWVPNITQKGIGEWSAKDIAYFLETGQMPDGDSAGGSMARVIKNTSQLSPEDRAAMAEYLKSLPPVEGPPRPKKKGGDNPDPARWRGPVRAAETSVLRLSESCNANFIGKLVQGAPFRIKLRTHISLKLQCN